MNELTKRESVDDPQDLEQLLVSRENAADVSGMTALYEPDAVIDCCDGQLVRGKEAIRDLFSELVAAGRKFDLGDQRPALICGDLALTSTRLPNGEVTAEVARRQDNGTWLWVIDRFSVT